MDLDDRRILRAKRIDIGINWQEFMHLVVEIIKPINSVEDLVDLKRLSQMEMKKNDK